MKDTLIEGCIGYLRFGYDFDGLDFPDNAESSFRELLAGDSDPSSAIQRYIEENGLETVYDASYDERGRYPGTRCIVNYFNIKDRQKLKRVEMYFSSVRICELFLNPMDDVFSFDYLKMLHQKMFGDIYPSAGMLRTAKVSKKTEFCQPEFISRQASDIFGRLAGSKYLKGLDDMDDFINELAYFMGEMEALHPFMDGNGRTSRFFFDRLSRNAGYELIWPAVDADRFLEANIAAIDGDYQPLVDVLEEIVIPVNDEA